ncbi:MAG TPA: DUF2807 domain-containing protein [Actinomycetota bacterium]|nr:DUF2807 domain-containing protein [Actinomycetota bacterium]
MPDTVLLADRYELRGPLGRGGMGEVYDGWDHRLDRPVAIKMLNSQLAAQADVRTRFESEARAAARLSNPKVVGVFDTGEHDGIPFIVMERLPGRTLADEIGRGPLPEERVRAVLLDMLEALGFAHRAGILHRDVKPSNVLLTDDGTAKLADFGIAKMAGQNLTQTGNFVGTAAYLAPERLNGLPAGPESDLYSAGIVAYEALTGTRPFEADTPLGLLRAISDDPAPSVRAKMPDVDEALGEAIDRATRRLPEERFQSAEQMMQALGAAVPIPAPSVPPTIPSKTGSPGTEVLPAPKGSRPAFNRRLAWVAAAAVLLLALVFRLVSAGDDDAPPGPAPQPSSIAPTAGTGAPGASRPIAGVNSIEFLGPGTLIVRQADSEDISVEAPDDLLPRIRTDVAGSRLTIGFDPGTGSGAVGSVVYRVTVKDLVELKSLGGGQIQATNLSGGSLVVENNGSTDIEMSGSTDHLTLTLNGSGNFDGRSLQAQSVEAELNGSGDASVSATDRLQAELSGSGGLEYSGNPEVSQSARGSGRVEKAG